MRSLPILVVLAVVLASCETPAAVGATCTRSSECTAPLVCAASRCRRQCVVHRDCVTGARCIVGNDGIGVCTLGDDRCTSAAECGEDLVCERGTCFDGCGADDCPAGGTCAGGVCERADVDAGIPTDAATDASRPVGCGVGDCAAGEQCARITWIQEAAPRCRRECTDSSDCTIPGNTSECVLAESGVMTYSVCTLPCDPFDPLACPEGESCDLTAAEPPDHGPERAIVECRGALGGRAEGESCELSGPDSSLCAALYSCEPYLPDMHWGCARICAADGSRGEPCPTGTTCNPDGSALRSLGTPLGACWPTP